MSSSSFFALPTTLAPRTFLPFFDGSFSITTSLYLPVLYFLSRYMKSRSPAPPFSLRYFSIVWNFLLAFFSFVGVLVMLFDSPLHYLAVFINESSHLPSTLLVMHLFCLSKMLEFGDTFLLVLKGKSLSFLHVYHHITVALYCWYSEIVTITFAHLFVLINLSIHSVMYGYYALAILLPRNQTLRKIRPIITICQTTQMVIGLFVNYLVLIDQRPFGQETVAAILGALMYLSYAVLFGLFYIDNYLQAKRFHKVPTLVFGTIHISAAMGLHQAFRLSVVPSVASAIFLMSVFSASVGYLTYSSSRSALMKEESTPLKEEMADVKEEEKQHAVGGEEKQKCEENVNDKEQELQAGEKLIPLTQSISSLPSSPSSVRSLQPHLSEAGRAVEEKVDEDATRELKKFSATLISSDSRSTSAASDLSEISATPISTPSPIASTFALVLYRLVNPWLLTPTRKDFFDASTTTVFTHSLRGDDGSGPSSPVRRWIWGVVLSLLVLGCSFRLALPSAPLWTSFVVFPSLLWVTQIYAFDGIFQRFVRCA